MLQSYAVKICPYELSEITQEISINDLKDSARRPLNNERVAYVYLGQNQMPIRQLYRAERFSFLNLLIHDVGKIALRYLGDVIFVELNEISFFLHQFNFSLDRFDCVLRSSA